MRRILVFYSDFIATRVDKVRDRIVCPLRVGLLRGCNARIIILTSHYVTTAIVFPFLFFSPLHLLPLSLSLPSCYNRVGDFSQRVSQRSLLACILWKNIIIVH